MDGGILSSPAVAGDLICHYYNSNGLLVVLSRIHHIADVSGSQVTIVRYFLTHMKNDHIISRSMSHETAKTENTVHNVGVCLSLLVAHTHSLPQVCVHGRY